MTSPFAGVWKCRFKGPRWGVRELVGSRASCCGEQSQLCQRPSPRQALLGAPALSGRGTDDSALPQPWEQEGVLSTPTQAGPFPRPWLRD